MRKTKRNQRRFCLTIPTIRKFRESIEEGNIGKWLIESGVNTGAGSVVVRYTLKHRPWIVTIEAKRICKR